eukprot:TRINITY_DN13394_c0_g1_i3.p1 TRINITY_DN13394_c0_g1~~TRINITY_DN13394_c0_g1_i3.p1  ORF type:complete len:238 (+),score=25.06 TRINITY_DN13394_c0_g1_i3:47-760(+)
MVHFWFVFCFALDAASGLKSGGGPVFPQELGHVMESLRGTFDAIQQSPNNDTALVNKLLDSAQNDLVDGLMEDSFNAEVASVADRLARDHLRWHMFAGGCPRDTTGCPSGWTIAEDGLCTPPADYDGLCGSINFAEPNLTAERKEKLSVKCRATWPCKHSCVLEYSQCPMGWSNVDGLCIAPGSYAGACSPAVDFRELDERDKAVWAAGCDAVWPCVDGAVGDRILENGVRNGPVRN